MGTVTFFADDARTIFAMSHQGDGSHYCIEAPGRRPLTYARLSAHIGRVVRELNRMGVGRNDRVGVVLPNGPEMATAFMSVSSAATCAPLNPAYRAPEFEFYLSDLNARALILPAGSDSPARDVADALGIRIIELSTEPDAEAGLFTFHGESAKADSPTSFAEPDDVALVLHTSGTTSRPKIVPLTHANLCASARHIRTSLELTDADRCLNVMPLFHIHGLAAAVLSSIAAGGSVVCTPGFDAGRFFEWLTEFKPTWTTAVPTMHQAVLAQPMPEGAPPQRTSLRFIRSCSSALPPQVMAALEERFAVPVVEAYGMTEAAHQMASNPLPPGERKAGSVGLPAGPEVAIMDEQGNLLEPEARGEIVIRGPNVTSGYENNEAANRNSFTNGWFRTGDEGYLSRDGYLYLTDRIKEIFNRGGEKVSPREIDEALMDHPAVAQAVTFAIPHPELGEDIAGAVVLREGKSADDLELRDFAAGRLADHKVPRQILILDAIPKGPTGKLQRISLGEKLGHLLKSEYVAPRTETETRLAGIWSELLNAERVGIDDNFFLLGGSSLHAVQMLARVEETFGVRVGLDAFYRRPKIAVMADLIAAGGAAETERAEASVETEPVVVPIQPNGTRPPFFMVGLGLGWEMRDVAPHLGDDQPVYGLRPSELIREPKRAHSAASLAAHYLEAMRAVRSEGPYMLGGGCAAGIVAFEMAQRLLAEGERVPLLALFDVDYPPPRFLPGLTGIWLLRLPRQWKLTKGLPGPERRAHLQGRLRHWRTRLFGSKGSRDGRAGHATSSKRARCSSEEMEARLAPLRDSVWRYAPKPYAGRIELFCAEETGVWSFHDRRARWRRVARDGCSITAIPGAHDKAMRAPHARVTAARLRARMDAALESAPESVLQER